LQVLFCFVQLTYVHIGKTSPIKCFVILFIFIQNLGTEFDGIMVLLGLKVAKPKIQAHWNFDLSNVLNGSLLITNQWLTFAFK
jgi:hypothetical protein